VDSDGELKPHRIAYLYFAAYKAYREMTGQMFPVVKSPNTLTSFMTSALAEVNKGKK